MQEREYANHDCAEEVVEHRRFGEQPDEADDGAERRDLDVAVRGGERLKKRRAQRGDGVAFLLESAGDEKSRVVGEVFEDERRELAAVVVIGGDKRREEIKSLGPVLVRFVSNGKDFSEEE